MNSRSVGVGLALCTAVISGFAIFLNSYAVRELTDPALFTTLKNAAAGLALLGLAALTVRRHDVARLDRRAWAGVTVVGLVGGSVPFLLFFTGLALASAPSAAFIHKTLFVWVAVLAVPLLGERLGWLQVGAMGALVASLALIAPPTGLSWGIGETMIAAATLFWAVEVIVARRLLAQVPVAVLGVGRLGIGLVVLVGYLVLSGKLGLVGALTVAQWTWVLLTGGILAGYVATWLAALQRAPATVVSSVLVLGAPITALLDMLAKGVVPAPLPLAGHLLLVAAVAAVAGGYAWRRARPELRPAESVA